MAEWGLSQASEGHAGPEDGHQPEAAMSFKVLADPVHRTIKVPDVVRQLLDTQQLQRLRDLKQLGTCYYVFPGASHNRFEHSLGVSHLAGESLEYLDRSRAPGGAGAGAPQPVTLDIQACVRIAGLVHDLGHGPFSHVFDGQFIPTVLPGSTWCHEDMSERMLDYLLDTNGIDVLDTEVAGLSGFTGREVVQAMVQGRKPWKGGKGIYEFDGRSDFLFEIVANKETGVDTDKWDYLYRDAHSLALPPSFDFNRIMHSQRVVNGRIAYHAGNVQDIYEMFHMRYTMFNKIYLHRATRSIELMLCDVLKLADSAFAPGHQQHRWLSGTIDDPAKYARLSDNRVLGRIEDYDDASNAGMSAAKELLGRLYRRKLYRFVDEQLLPAGLTMREDLKLTPEALAQYNPNPTLDLRPEDIGVHDLKLDYGKKDKNPVDDCPFYRSPWDTAFCKIKGSSVSHVGIPGIFRERKLRVYSRRADERYVDAILECFARWCRDHGIPHARAHPSSKANNPPSLTLDESSIAALADEHDAVSAAAGAASDTAALRGSGRLLSGEEVYRPRAVDDFDFHRDDREEGGGSARRGGHGVGAAPHGGRSVGAAVASMMHGSASAQSLHHLGGGSQQAHALTSAAGPVSLVPPFPVSRGSSTTPSRSKPLGAPTPSRAGVNASSNSSSGGGGSNVNSSSSSSSSSSSDAVAGSQLERGGGGGLARPPRRPQHPPTAAAAPPALAPGGPAAGGALPSRGVSASTAYSAGSSSQQLPQTLGGLLGIGATGGSDDDDDDDDDDDTGAAGGGSYLAATARASALAGGGGGGGGVGGVGGAPPQPQRPTTAAAAAAAAATRMSAAAAAAAAAPSAAGAAFASAATLVAERATRDHPGAAGATTMGGGGKRDIRAFFASSSSSQPAPASSLPGGDGGAADAKRTRTGGSR